MLDSVGDCTRTSLLSNHFHLCLKTVDANLVTGMQWLQSTFANRFNRFAHGRGHVFQGRYQSLHIEDGESLLRVVNYIHLNPVRAGLQTIEMLKAYSYGSSARSVGLGTVGSVNTSTWAAFIV